MNLESLHQYVIARLIYNPYTGVFTWRDGHRAGQIAGGYKATPGKKGEGYRRIKLLGKKYRTGRLAYFYCFGEWPRILIDHKDRVRDNDRLSNLRDATYSQNNSNSGRLRKYNKHVIAWQRFKSRRKPGPPRQYKAHVTVYYKTLRCA